MPLAPKSPFQPTRLAALALFSIFILIETGLAVEVSGPVESTLPAPRQSVSKPPHLNQPVPAPSQDCFILAARSFTIPFTVDQSGARPLEVRLYVSRGPDDPWQMISHKRPDELVPQFEFTAATDGEYWFATRTIDAEGKAHPSSKIEPQLKVYVDTTRPLVELTVDASADGRVDASLIVNDATPIKSLLIRYVTDGAKEWQTLTGDGLLTGGALVFSPPEPWERISMQVVATDKAGNQTIVNRLLNRPRVAEVPGSRFSATGIEAQTRPDHKGMSERTRAQAVSSPVIRLDRNLNEQVQYQANQPTATNPIGGYATDAPTWPFRGYRGAANQPAPPQNSPVPARFGAAAIAAASQAPSTSDVSGQSPTGPTMTTGNDLPGDDLGLNSPQQSPRSQQPVETIPTPHATAEKPELAQPRTASEAMRPLSGQSEVPQREKIQTPKPERRQSNRPATVDVPRAPIRHSDSERFSLDYELQAVGNLGVDAIELYGSTDGGQTWSLWGTDPDRVSPFDIETKEPGVFSFRIVVVGRNGLASPRPQAGETPDIVVVVDKEKPQVRITAAQYGEGNRIGALVIRYEAVDANLGPRPIALSFSDSTNGPWTTIAAGLRNDGDYVWPADPELPRRIYLRIDCKDEAGNVGTYILDQPIDVQGLAPRARIRGFQSLSGIEAFPVDEQTAERTGASFK